MLGYCLHFPKRCLCIILRLEYSPFAVSVGSVWMHYLVMDETGCTSTVISCLTPEDVLSVGCYFRIFFSLLFSVLCLPS